MWCTVQALPAGTDCQPDARQHSLFRQHGLLWAWPVPAHGGLHVACMPAHGPVHLVTRRMMCRRPHQNLASVGVAALVQLVTAAGDQMDASTWIEIIQARQRAPALQALSAV